MNSSKESEILRCLDYRVSGKEFSLDPVEDGSILMTVPQPSEDELFSYYESEDYISHTDSRENFLDKLYQSVKGVMLKRKLNWIKGLYEGGSLLDVGAGTGDFLLEAKKEGWEVFGIEPSQKARERALSKGIDLMDKIDFNSSSAFDVITMWHVLEHVPDYKSQIVEMRNLLKPGGILVVAVPNFKSYDARKYNHFWAGYDVPRHLWHFSRVGIINAITEKGFVFEKERPLIFDSFYVSLLSEKYKTGKRRVLPAFKNGLFSNLRAARTGEYSSLTYFFRKLDN